MLSQIMTPTLKLNSKAWRLALYLISSTLAFPKKSFDSFGPTGLNLESNYSSSISRCYRTKYAHMSAYAKQMDLTYTME